MKEDQIQTANPRTLDRIPVPELELFKIIMFNVSWMSRRSLQSAWHLQRRVMSPIIDPYIRTE